MRKVGEESIGNSAYRYYVLGLLTTVGILNFIDRQILSILLQPIKEEMLLSDTQLGLLSGIAFAIFFTFFAIPIALWADRHSRRNLIASALTMWSLMTALSGAAFNFTTLLLTRMGVAVGESGSGPAAQSVIADYFPPHQRSRAMSVYSLAIPVGIIIGFTTGGWVNEVYGWRVAFMVVGLPGVAVALLLRLTLREPARGASENRKATDDPPKFRKTLAYLWKCRTYRHMVFAAALHALASYGLLNWTPSFFIRSHHLGTAEIALILGIALGIGGGVGTIVGGVLSEKLAVKDVRYYLLVPGIAGLVAMPFQFGVFLSSDPRLGLMLYSIPAFFGSFWTGPVHAVGQTIVPLQMRAMSAAGMLFVINLIGLGLGPQLVGIISDVLRPTLGVESLRYALLAIIPFNLWAGVHYWLGSRTVKLDMES